MTVTTYDPKEIPQLKWAGLAGLFLLPLCWWLFVLYVVAPLLLPSITTPEGEVDGYALNLIQLAGYLFEFFLAIYVLRREGQRFTWPALRTRLNLRWGGWKAWGLFIALFVVAFALTQPLVPISKITAAAAPPPAWFPASQHPLKEVNGVEDALPGVEFKGNYLFLLLFLFVGTMNIIGTDTWYRGVLIPKLHGLFGRWAWAAGGLIFALRYLYVWWRVQEALLLGLAGAFMFGPMGSLPFAMLAHFIGNFALTWPLVIKMVVFG
jgi:hypothetical protein